MKLIQILKKNAIPSFCSSNSQVIEILFKFCKFHKVPLLVESTSNQVNQYGGYSNNTPKEFIKKIKKIAEKEKFNKKKLFFGGDHLGPLPWKLHKSREALRRSIRLIRSYINADYQKIHIDTSIKCLNDNKINNKIVFERTALIFRKLNLDKYKNLFFVFGTEVPLSGGNDKSKIKQTSITQIKEEHKNFKNLLKSETNSFALVIEPGMKFMHNNVTKPIFKNFVIKKKFSKKNNFIFEAHSTDYQQINTLKKLVSNNFKFLKVGPELTYELTRSILFMEKLEKTLNYKSNFSKVLYLEMKKNRKYWLSYFNNKKKTVFDKIVKSKFDRTRYYLERKKVLKAINILKNNINNLELNKILIKLRRKDKKYFIKIKKVFRLNNFQTLNYFYLNKVLIKYFKACDFKLNNLV